MFKTHFLPPGSPYCPHPARGSQVVPGIPGGTVSSPSLESDTHTEAFHKHLFIGCKLHEGRTLLVLFSGTFSTSCNAWPRKVAGSCALNTELIYFLLPSSINRGHYGSRSYGDKGGKSARGKTMTCYKATGNLFQRICTEREDWCGCVCGQGFQLTWVLIHSWLWVPWGGACDLPCLPGSPGRT